MAGADTLLARLGWQGEVGSLGLTAEGLFGRTSVRGGSSLLGFDGPIMSSGYRFQADRPLLGGMGTFGFTMPVAVTRAAMSYNAPVAYNWENGAFTMEDKRFSVAPSAREMNLELGWKTAFSGDEHGFGAGYLSLGAAYGVNQGNVAGRSSKAAWLRYGKRY